MQININELDEKALRHLNKISPVKYCTKCKIQLTDGNWYSNDKKTTDGYSRYICTRCGLDRTNSYRKERRRLLQENYGNKCNCCGYDKDIRALDIDHVFNDGAEERKTVSDMVIHVTNLGYPKDRYQLLCRTCNKMKLFNNGHCNCKEESAKTLNVKEFKRKTKYSNIKYQPLETKKCTDCEVQLDSSNYKNIKSDKKGNLKYLCIQCNQFRQRNATLSRRQRVLNEYGNKCVQCDFNLPMGLEIDHINNDGNTERNEKKVKCLYRHVMKLNYPKDRYQLLCANCNYLKHHDNN